MGAPRVAAGCSAFLGMAMLLADPAAAQERAGSTPGSRPQAKQTRQSPPSDSVRVIEESYERQLLELDRTRVRQLTELAGRQKPDEAAATYEHLFRLAVAGNLFVDAEPAATSVLRGGSLSSSTTALAYLIKIVAESDRGAFEASLATLRSALDEATKSRAGRPALLTSEIVSLCDAYYQRLVRADQFEVAMKAFQLAQEKVNEPALKAFLAGRLKRLELVGKPAPPIRGKDLDGKPFNLADAKGQVVLVEFWATWCPPSGDETEWLKETSHAYRPRGFRVLGVNVDALREGSGAVRKTPTAVRRFLLDHNVTWPTLLNGTGEADYAGAFGVTDIPANVVVAKDGTVAHVDLVRDGLDEAIARELAR